MNFRTAIFGLRCDFLHFAVLYYTANSDIAFVGGVCYTCFKRCPPCLKGGAERMRGGGIFTERKHNTELTQLAKRLRKNMTDEERHLWYDFLCSYPLRFLRQKVIDNYIVDFYCHQARLVIEIDGSQHYEDIGLLKDRIRTEKIESRNLTVIRIPNNDVKQHFRGVCEYIDLCVQQNMCAKESPSQPTADSPL